MHSVTVSTAVQRAGSIHPHTLHSPSTGAGSASLGCTSLDTTPDLPWHQEQSFSTSYPSGSQLSQLLSGSTCAMRWAVAIFTQKVAKHSRHPAWQSPPLASRAPPLASTPRPQGCPLSCAQGGGDLLPQDPVEVVSIKAILL